MKRFISKFIDNLRKVSVSKKHLAVYTIVFAVVGVVLFGISTQAVHAGMLEDIGNGFLWLLTQVALLLARLCMAIAIFMLRFFIQLGAYNGFLDAPIVRLGWVMVRDVANMFFVVALLVIAFATILGRESYEWKKAMVKLVLVAIFVNFSLLICGVVLDAAHVFTVTFINAIAPVAAGNLIQMFNFDSMLSIITSSSDGDANIRLALLGGAVVAFFFAAMAALSIGAYCIILLYRMVSIWALLIFSPLAFVLSVLPATESYFEDWKSEFSKNVISAPIAVFFLWLAFATMGANSAVTHLNQYSGAYQIQDGIASGVIGDTQSVGEGTNSISLNAASTWASMAGFLVAMAFLLKGIEEVQKLGVRGAGWLDSAQNFAKNVVTIGSGYALGRWLVGKGVGMGQNTLANVGLAVGTQTGVVQGWKRVFSGKGFFLGARQRAESRLARLDEEKSQDEKRNQAIGRRDNTLVDKAISLVGFRTAGESLAIASVKAELAEHEGHEAENERKIDTERAAREGKLDGTWFAGGRDLSHRFEHATEHEITVKQKQAALDDSKLAESRSLTKKIRLEEDEHKKEALVQAIISGNVNGVQLQGIEDGDKEKIKNANDALVAAKKSLEEINKDENATEEDRAAANKAVEEAEKRLDASIGGRQKVKNANDALVAAKKSFEKINNKRGSTEEEKREAYEAVEKAEARLADAVGAVQKNMSYQERRANDAILAREGGFVMSDAAIQNIRATENEGDEKDSLEGIRGEYDVAYSLIEDKEVRNKIADIDKKLLQEKYRELAPTIAEEIAKAEQELVQEVAKIEEDKGVLQGEISRIKGELQSLAEDTLQANYSGDQDEVERLDVERAGLLQDLEKKEKEFEKLNSDDFSRERLSPKKEAIESIKNFSKVENERFALQDTILNEETSKEDKEKASARLKELTHDIANNPHQAALSAMALSRITQQDRALAYKAAGLDKDYIKFGGDVFAKEQQKYVNKSKKIQERIVVRASDVVRGLEGKPMDELEEEIETTAKKVIANGSRTRGQFDLHVREMKTRFNDIQRLRALQKEKEKVGDKLNDAEVDLLKNATQDMMALFAGGVDQFKTSFGAVLQLVDGLQADGIALDATDNLPKTMVALLTGRNYSEVDKMKNEDIIAEMQKVQEKQFKEKDEEMMAAARMALNNSGIGHFNNQVSFGYDQRGRRVLGLTRLAGSGVSLGDDDDAPAYFSTGTTQDGAKMQEELAISNIYGSQIIQKLNDLRILFGTGKHFGLSVTHSDRTRQLAEQLALISSNQLDLAQWRRLGGGSGDNGAYNKETGEWTIREAEYVEYFGKLIKGWNDILHDPNKTRMEHQDVEKRIRNMLSASGVEEVAPGVSVATASAEQMADFLKGVEFKVSGGASISDEIATSIKGVDFKMVNSKHSPNQTPQSIELPNTPNTVNDSGTSGAGSAKSAGTSSSTTQASFPAQPVKVKVLPSEAQPMSIPQFLAGAGSAPTGLVSSGAQLRTFKTFDDMKKELVFIAHSIENLRPDKIGEDMARAIDSLSELGFQKDKLVGSSIKDIGKQITDAIESLDSHKRYIASQSRDTYDPDAEGESPEEEEEEPNT